MAEGGFPAGFYWGAATAAYQIEGAIAEDGKSESIWDRFAHTPGKIDDRTNGDIACDHYHRWPEDVALMARLGLSGYRFSTAWARILPEGYGRVNQAGLDYYSRLVDALLAEHITPFVTLYHWDLPQALQERGGWESRDTAKAFAELAHVVTARLGDRVRHWITHNEPHIVVFHGYVTGTKAPGLTNPALIGPVAHHLLLSHGLAAQAIRSESPQAQVGITLNLTALEPASDRSEDIEATTLLDGLHHRWYLDPLYGKGYPEDAARLVRMPADVVRSGDMETIATPTDFLGVNYYTRYRVRAGRGELAIPQMVEPTGRLTTMGWEIYPQGLTELLARAHREYAPKMLYVTESGVAFPDAVAADGHVHDPARADYLREHFHAARDAMAQGVPVGGYFVWSLMDNFEWSYGFTQRFGLLYTDYRTQRRIIKDSGFFMQRIAATNGADLD
ncbi:MAG TPA: GH1 family beta-glucosidase [Ktedonobacterales bacterium]